MTQSIARQGTSVPQQVTALVRVELILLRRNWNATLLAVVTPLLTGFLLARSHGDGVSLGVYGIAGAMGFTALFSVHYHLTTVYAARRQELVLKRLRVGEPSGRTILTATALSGILVFIGQVVVLVTFGLVTLDLPVPANPLTMMLTIFLGAAVLAAGAAALSGVTRSSEAAMFTTMPSTMLLLATPGVLAQPGTLPQSIETVGAYLTNGSIRGGAPDRLAWPRRRRRTELPRRHRRRTSLPRAAHRVARIGVARREVFLPLGTAAVVIVTLASLPERASIGDRSCGSRTEKRRRQDERPQRKGEARA